MDKDSVNCGLQIAKEIVIIQMEKLENKFMKDLRDQCTHDMLRFIVQDIEKVQRKNND